jgi:hypothetical protein
MDIAEGFQESSTKLPVEVRLIGNILDDFFLKELQRYSLTLFKLGEAGESRRGLSQQHSSWAQHKICDVQIGGVQEIAREFEEFLSPEEAGGGGFAGVVLFWESSQLNQMTADLSDEVPRNGAAFLCFLPHLRRVPLPSAPKVIGLCKHNDRPAAERIEQEEPLFKIDLILSCEQSNRWGCCGKCMRLVGIFHITGKSERPQDFGQGLRYRRSR